MGMEAEATASSRDNLTDCRYQKPTRPKYHRERSVRNSDSSLACRVLQCSDHARGCGIDEWQVLRLLISGRPFAPDYVLVTFVHDIGLHAIHKGGNQKCLGLEARKSNSGRTFLGK